MVNNKMKYDEQLKTISMMARRNNVVMRESNDNIDHKNMVKTRISFADEVKYLS